MVQLQRNILAGNEVANYGFRSVNEVTTTPKVFNDWMYTNASRIRNAVSKPYFIRDNRKYCGTVLNSKEDKRKAISDARQKRHAQRNEDFIRQAWNSRTHAPAYMTEVFTRKMGVGSALGSRKAEKEGWDAFSKFDSTVHLSKDMRDNASSIKEILGDKSQLIPRDFFEADNGIPNKVGGNENCVNVVLANEMLRRGINVTAKIDYIPEFGEDKYARLFLNKKGKSATINKIIADNETVFLSKTKKELREGRYILGWNNADDALDAKMGIIKQEDIGGHVLVAEMTPSGLQIYDHQDKCFVSIKAIFQNMDLEHGLEYLRIDNKSITTNKEDLEKLIQVLH